MAIKMEKNFEYYLEMARGPVRYKFADESSKELIDNVENTIDRKLEGLDHQNDKDFVEFDIEKAIDRDEYFHDEAKALEFLLDMEEVIRKLTPKYKKQGWSEIEFDYPMIKLIK